MSTQSNYLLPIWTPADFHEVWERAATTQAIRAVSEEFPQAVGESPLLAEWVEVLL